MRVIAGTSRGRALRAPTGQRTRPTADRVREAIFNVLGGLVEIEGADVGDLFAGSGAMGIEALSRGAGTVTFVDNSPAALRTVRANVTGTGLDPDATRVVRADVVDWLLRPHRFDLAFCDPPYAFRAWPELLGRLRAEVAVIESDRPVEAPASWEIIRNKRYGGTLVTVVRSRQPHAAAEAHQKGTP
ncbi:MAG TPA: RsmD family RNA methyltransferase [Acidimicrobiales bacterium]|nr:RsmD family RNA methyltransferase [Acidimicrobiales bacterium]